MDVIDMINDIMEVGGLSQEQVAVRLDVDKSQVSRWLDGAHPKVFNLRKIKKLHDEVLK